MTNWRTELDEFFREHDQGTHGGAASTTGLLEAAEFVGSVAAPAFQAFAMALQEHGCHTRLMQADTSVRIIVEEANVSLFDYTLWVGTSAISTDARARSQRLFGVVRNEQGSGARADVSQDDIEKHLTNAYIALNTPAVAG